MSSPFTFANLRTVQAVARHASFSRAAEELDVSQPHVSAQIAALEARLGVPLFNRAGRRVHPTEAGQRLLHHAVPALRLLADAERAMTELRGLVSGRLTVAASSTPGPFLLPRPLSRFAADHPGVELALEISNLRQVERAVLEERAEVGVTAGEPASAHVVAHPIGKDEILLAVGPRHRFAERKRVVEFGELAREPLILREQGSGTRGVLDREFGRVGLTPRRALELSSVEAIKESVASHLGITFVSRHAIRHELACGTIRGLRVPGLRLGRSFYVVTLRGKQLSPAAAAIHGLLLAQAGGRAGSASTRPAPAPDETIPATLWGHSETRMVPPSPAV